MNHDNTLVSSDDESDNKSFKAPISFSNGIATLNLSCPIEIIKKNETGAKVKETLHTINIKSVTMGIYPIFITGSSLKICSFLTDISEHELGELSPQDTAILLYHVNREMQPIIAIFNDKIELDMSAITDNLTYDMYNLPEEIETDTGFTDVIRINKAKFKHYDMWESKARNLVFIVEKLTGISRFYLERLKPKIGAALYKHVDLQVKLFLQTPGF